MNKLRFTFRSNPQEVFDSSLADLTLEWPVVSVSLNGTLIDGNIDLVYTGAGNNRNIIVKEYTADLTKNFDNLSFTMSTRKINYEQIPGLGYQCQDEDSFISDAEYNHISQWSNIVFTVAEVMKVEYSEDDGATWNSFKYDSCYAYMIPGGLFNGKELVSTTLGSKIPGSTREKIAVADMISVAAQLGLPYTNEGMPIIARPALGFDSYMLINYNGQSDVSSVVAQEDLNVDQYTCLCFYTPE